MKKKDTVNLENLISNIMQFDKVDDNRVSLV